MYAISDHSELERKPLAFVKSLVSLCILAGKNKKAAAPMVRQLLYALIITLLVLASGLRLLATLDAGALIMLSLTNFGDDASLGAAALETLQSAVDGLAVLHMNFRHLYFPPSEVSG